MFIPKKRQPAGEWGYFTLAPHIDMRMLPQESQHDLFEPVLVVSVDVHVSSFHSKVSHY